jgi:hypothetical protein
MACALLSCCTHHEVGHCTPGLLCRSSPSLLPASLGHLQPPSQQHQHQCWQRSLLLHLLPSQQLGKDLWGCLRLAMLLHLHSRQQPLHLRPCHWQHAWQVGCACMSEYMTRRGAHMGRHAHSMVCSRQLVKHFLSCKYPHGARYADLPHSHSRTQGAFRS